MGDKEGRFILVRGNIDGHPVTLYMQPLEKKKKVRFERLRMTAY